jgi:hypothetical protein
MGERLPCKQEGSGSNPLVSMGGRGVAAAFFDRVEASEEKHQRPINP